MDRLSRKFEYCGQAWYQREVEIPESWQGKEIILRFWSQSNAVCDEFAELFESTFGLQLDPDSPFLMARELGLSESQLDAMVNADPWHPVFDH